jgi:DNA mismatch endonuclease (patch repair protein)
MDDYDKMKMTYKSPSHQVSQRMKKIKSKGTTIELKMKKIMDEMNISYIFQPNKIFGKPDFKIDNTNILIFCDSAFWHGKRENEIDGTAFKKNKDFWMNKLKYNKERDEKINQKLRRNGWSVYRFWDTDILKNKDKVKKKLRRALNAQTK